MTSEPRRTNIGQMFAGSRRDSCALPPGESAASATVRRSRTWLVIVASVILAACSSNPGLSTAPQALTRVVNIGVELPMSGGEASDGVPTFNGVKLAVADANAAGGIGGYTFGVNSQDDAVNGVNDPQQGAGNITTLVKDRSVIGVVGPLSSGVAEAEIPVSNAAGLLQCSPANTGPGLTKEWGGVDPKTYRPAHPNEIAYVRVAPTDDAQGLAGAQIAYQDIGARHAYVVDDATTYGAGVAGVFVTGFEKLGGTVVRHDGLGSNVTDYAGLLTAARALHPDVVYYGGFTTDGGGPLRKEMVAAGIAGIPFLGADGINDGSAATSGSFLNLAGAQGDPGTWSTVLTAHDLPNAGEFAAKYDAAFGTKSPGAYSAAAYACTQVILDAYRHVGTPDRAGIRAYVTSGATFDTVLGTIHFDANGDTCQQIISEYTFDATVNGGDWRFVRQVDFGQSAGTPSC